MKYKITVDRIEENVLICVDEAGDVREIKKSDLTAELTEGDICVIEFTDAGEVISLKKDNSLTENKKAEMKTRLSKLFKIK